MVETRFVGSDPELFEGLNVSWKFSGCAKVCDPQWTFCSPRRFVELSLWWRLAAVNTQSTGPAGCRNKSLQWNVSKSWITSWHPIFCPVILVKQPFDLFQFLITSQPSLSIPPPMIRYLKKVLKTGYESLSEIIVCPYFNLTSELGNGWLVMIVMASVHKESMMKATRPGRVIAKLPRRSNLSSQYIVLLCRVVQSWLSKEKSPGHGNNELLHSMPRAK